MSNLLICFALFGTLVCSAELKKDLNIAPFYNPVHYEQVSPDGGKNGFVKPVVRYEFEPAKKK